MGKKIKRVEQYEKDKNTANVKDILKLLAGGAFLAASLVFPTLPMVVAPFINEYERQKAEERRKEWARYNLWRLRETVRRLHQQKMVEIVEKDGEETVVLTEKGKRRLLKYKLEEMEIKRPKKWDGRWRLIIYDISKFKKNTQKIFRETLKRLKFLRLQKSVYLCPFLCRDEIEFLRQYYDLGDDVIYLTISGLEDEEAYRKYFGL